MGLAGIIHVIHSEYKYAFGAGVWLVYTILYCVYVLALSHYSSAACIVRCIRTLSASMEYIVSLESGSDTRC